MKKQWWLLALAATVGPTLLSCLDPVTTDAITALGPEPGGREPDENHRPGQPCLLCHGGNGPGEPTFSVAGTVYKTLKDKEPAEDAVVHVFDATGAEYTVTTNKAGNFYFRAGEEEGRSARDDDGPKANPIFPLQIEVEGEGKRAKMTSWVNGSGSCATCHVGDGSNERAPVVYLFRE